MRDVIATLKSDKPDAKVTFQKLSCDRVRETLVLGDVQTITAVFADLDGKVLTNKLATYYRLGYKDVSKSKLKLISI